jgi:ribosome biogenesis GTPase
VDSAQRFSKRSKFHQQMKMRRTADLRAADAQTSAGLENLPLGEVIQIFSLFVEILHDGVTYLATRRKTQKKLEDTELVVGDLVRFLKGNTTNEAGQPEASIEQVMPRQTILVRQHSFRKETLDPIVANAQQMLIVASILTPRVKWGLVDRMLIAAESGGLKPIVVLNKIDLAADEPDILEESLAVLMHYRTLGVTCLTTSTLGNQGTDELRELLGDQRTVLAGHSGVGKSSLIRSIAPELDIRVGEVSTFNEKGTHTTTSARRYPLPFGGFVIDTPGVKQFGLVGVDAEELLAYFPDVADGSAPEWRRASYEGILAGL